MDIEISSTLRTRPRRRLSRGRPHRRRIPPMSVLPTLFTLVNLVAGFAAIHYATKAPDFQGPWGWSGLTFAGILVFVGMLSDGVDGSIARLTRSSSTIGAQLDSLCDMVTFGVAPAFMALRLVITHLEETGPVFLVVGPEVDTVLGRVIWGIAAAFVCCAALRLARYNVESGLDLATEKRYFRGLPTPGAAGAVVSLVILHQHLLVTKFGGELPRELVQWATLMIPFVMLLCAFGMVSGISYVHVTNTYLRGPKSFAFVARIVIALALAIWWLQETLAIVFTCYALSGPVRLAWRALHRRPSHPAGGAPVPAASTSNTRSNTLST